MTPIHVKVSATIIQAPIGQLYSQEDEPIFSPEPEVFLMLHFFFNGKHVGSRNFYGQLYSLQSRSSMFKSLGFAIEFGYSVPEGPYSFTYEYDSTAKALFDYLYEKETEDELQKLLE